MSKTVIIVQARMGSSRLPGKVLKKILGRPMLDLQIERLTRVTRADAIVVATSTSIGDDPIEELARDLAVECWRGSENDVLSRYYDAARAVGADTIIRVTGDCPLIDPELIDSIIADFNTHRDAIDYCSNTVERTFPRGLDTEVFSIEALDRAFHNATNQPEREHVTPYIWRNASLFNIRHYTNSDDHSHHRWTVDTVPDLVLVRKLFEALYPHQPRFTWHDCLDVLAANPDWVAINADITQKAVS